MVMPIDFDFDDAQHQLIHADHLEETGFPVEAELVRACVATGDPWRERSPLAPEEVVGLNRWADRRFGFLRSAWVTSPPSVSLADRRRRFIKDLRVHCPLDLEDVELPWLESFEWRPDFSSPTWLGSAPRLKRVVLDARDAKPEHVPALEHLVGRVGEVALTVVIFSREVLEQVAGLLRARAATTLAVSVALVADDEFREFVRSLGLPVEVRVPRSWEDQLGYGVAESDEVQDGPGIPTRSCCGHCLSFDAQLIYQDEMTTRYRCMQCRRTTSMSFSPPREALSWNPSYEEFFGDFDGLVAEVEAERAASPAADARSDDMDDLPF